MVKKFIVWLREITVVYFYMKKKTKISSVYGMMASENYGEEHRTW